MIVTNWTQAYGRYDCEFFIFIWVSYTVTCAQYQSSKFTQFYLEEDAIGVIFSLILSFDAIK